MPQPQRIKLQDVAQATGVSIATVSRAVSRPELVSAPTLQRVSKAIAALGYLPAAAAQALASGRSMTIGAIVPTLDHAIFARAIQAMQATLLSSGYQLVVAAHDYVPAAEAAAVRTLLGRGVDGLMLVGAERLDETWRVLAASSVPVLLTWSFDDRLPCIGFDNKQAGRLAARHLLDLGHRRFGMISGMQRSNDRARLRIAGATSELAKARLKLPPWRLIEQPFTLAGGRAGLTQLLACIEPPSAIICGNDLLAAGALFEAQARGIKVPDQLSIVGIDNLEISAHVFPPLTTVHLPTAELGERAATSLIAALRGESLRQRVELPVELVVRHSTAPWP